MRGGKNLMTSSHEDAWMLSLCFRNWTLERSVHFIPAWGRWEERDAGQKEPSKPCKPQSLGRSLLPSSTQLPGSRGQREGPQELPFRFRVQREDSGGTQSESLESLAVAAEHLSSPSQRKNLNSCTKSLPTSCPTQVWKWFPSSACLRACPP